MTGIMHLESGQMPIPMSEIMVNTDASYVSISAHK